MTTVITRFVLLAFVFLLGCTPVAGDETADSSGQSLPAEGDTATGTPVPPGATPSLPTNTAEPTSTAVAPDSVTTAAPVGSQTPASLTPDPPTPTLTPASTVAALLSTPAPTPTPTLWPTVTRQVLPPEIAAGLMPCSQRTVPDELLILVTQQFALPESYAPTDLVLLDDIFGDSVTVGIENQVRQIILDPLQQIIEAMHAAGLHPSILSGYRSYDVQYLAWKWWNSQYPERVAIMSARAGYSEHQLGTTVDFGSPEIDHLFHVDFANTQEGLWLRDNAHRYGFTMSYPANSYAITGFKYEPWHFRYVGAELATQLYTSGQILTQWQLEHLPPPCIP